MAIKKYRPLTPSTRYRTTHAFEEITKSTPEKSLLAPRKSSGGRNNNGHVTSRHRGGGHKRMLRILDFLRDKHGIPARVASIEYDPNRTANIALLFYVDGEKRYILAPVGLKVDDTIMSGPEAEYRPGNSLPLGRMPLGAEVHNVELRSGKGGQVARSAGVMVQLVAKEAGKAILRMPSGELRTATENCYATVGQVGNIDHKNISLGKAGASRWRGIRPHVRGVAMNPVDHPMGGGEGRSSGGRHPCSPWGKKTKGMKTRKTKPSDKVILERRKKK